MSPNPTEVLIAGGGVAGLETLLALRALAGDRVHVTILAPEPDFVYRPLQTGEPFSFGHATRRPLWHIAEAQGATLIADGVAEVRALERQVRCTSGVTVPYDVLVLAVGTIAEPIEHATTFTGDHARELMGGVLADLEEGYSHSVAFVAPAAGWTLPLYELAIMTAREVWAQGIDDARFTLVTPEERPLGMFGDQASAEVGEMLAAERIDFVGSTSAELHDGYLVLGADGERLEVERVVSLPRLRGPAIAGVTSDADGFITVDGHGRVGGLEDVYAAGDATDYPVQPGGLATQQADTVAETIAERLGAPVHAQPFRPLLRGLLLTGARDRYFVAGAGARDGADPGRSAEHPLWWPPSKIAGRYLAPYLFEGTEGALLDRARYAPHIDVEAALPTRSTST